MKTFLLFSFLIFVSCTNFSFDPKNPLQIFKYIDSAIENMKFINDAELEASANKYVKEGEDLINAIQNSMGEIMNALITDLNFKNKPNEDVFRENVNFLIAYNMDPRNEVYLNMNSYIFSTEDEMKSKVGLFESPKKNLSFLEDLPEEQSFYEQIYLDEDNLPEVDQSEFLPVHYENKCGNCWAYSLSTVLTSAHKRHKKRNASIPDAPAFYSPQFLMDMMNTDTGNAVCKGCCGRASNDILGGENLVHYLWEHKLPSITAYPVKDHTSVSDNICYNENIPLSRMGIDVAAYQRHKSDYSNQWLFGDKNPFENLEYNRYEAVTKEVLIEKIQNNGPLNIALWVTEGNIKEYLRILLMGSGFITRKNCGNHFRLNHNAVIYGRKVIRSPSRWGFATPFKKLFTKNKVDAWLIRNSWNNPNLYYDASKEFTCGVGKDVEVFSIDS